MARIEPEFVQSEPYIIGSPEDLLWKDEADELAFNNLKLRDLPEFSHARFVIFPDDAFIGYWQLLISLLLLYTATVTIFRIAFIENDSTGWTAADLAIDSIFFTDVLINCSLAYYDIEMNLVISHKAIVIHYLRTWMLLDLLACMPITYIFGADKNYSNVVRMARLPRLYKLIKVTKMMRMLKIFSDRTSLNRNVKGFFQVSLGMERLIWMLLTFLILIHIIACFWALVGTQDMTDENWIFAGGFVDKGPWDLYVIAFYWAITTMATVGYGDITAKNNTERLFCSLVMLIGIFLYSYVISSITSLLGNLDTRKSELSKKMGLLNELARQFNLSKLFYKKLSKAIEYENSRSISGELTELINGLPSKMRSELLYVIHKKMIETNTFFDGKALVFVAEVTKLLRPLRTEMREIVYREDEMAVEMYLIYKGEVSFVIPPNLTPYLTVSANYYFGEADILVSDKSRHTATVVTNTVCELFTIEKEALMSLLDKYPEVRLEMISLARDRLQRSEDLKIAAREAINGKIDLQRVNSKPRSFAARAKFVNALIQKNIEEVEEDSRESAGSDSRSDDEEGTFNSESLGQSNTDSDVQLKSMKTNRSEVNFYDIMTKLSSFGAPTSKKVPRTNTYIRLKSKVSQLESNIMDIQRSQSLILGRLDSLVQKLEDEREIKREDSRGD